jgi:putative transposase
MTCKVRDGGRWWYKSGFVYAFNYELCEMPVTYPSHNIRILGFSSKWLRALCRLLLRCWHAFRRWLSNSLDLQASTDPPQDPAGTRWMRSVSCRADFSKPPHWKHKPDWVRAGVLQLARELPKAGYRTIANCFNLQQAVLHGDDSHGGESMTVSKSYVAKLVTANRLALSATRTSALVRRARMGEIQTTWGLDMTGLPLADGSSVPVFGVIDHGSRAVLHLQPVASFNSLILLGKLLITMGTLGKPVAVRSDNASVFKTWTFRSLLKVIGVQQQFTDVGSPWQNGRIERFWRTLKGELHTVATRSIQNSLPIQTRMKFASLQTMTTALDIFKFSYNADRPHQSLGGRTPAQVWNAQVQQRAQSPPAE